MSVDVPSTESLPRYEDDNLDIKLHGAFVTCDSTDLRGLEIKKKCASVAKIPLNTVVRASYCFVFILILIYGHFGI